MVSPWGKLGQIIDVRARQTIQLFDSEPLDAIRVQAHDFVLSLRSSTLIEYELTNSTRTQRVYKPATNGHACDQEDDVRSPSRQRLFMTCGACAEEDEGEPEAKTARL